MAFRDYARLTLPNLHPVIANANDAVAQELTFFLRYRADVLLACDLDN